MDKAWFYDIIKESIPVGFSIVDKDGIIVDFNTAAERITGYSREEVIGRSHLQIIHGAPEKTVCPLFTYVFDRHEQTVATEVVMKKKGGEMVTVSVTVTPFFDSQGSFIGGVELFRDISEIKKLERERQSLLSMFAHDMKNPVIIAAGFVQRLLSGKAGPMTDQQRDHCLLVMDELKRVQAMLTDFLEFSRFETTEYTPELSPYNAEAELARHIEAIKIEAEKKDIQIVFEKPARELSSCKADTMLIGRVIANLLDNAVKYTGEGGVVTVRLSQKNSETLIEVQDTGIGIAPEELPFVFDAFYRASKDTKGSGLGLSIAKTIVKAHGGRIWVESTQGMGSKLSFTLPAR